MLWMLGDKFWVEQWDSHGMKNWKVADSTEWELSFSVSQTYCKRNSVLCLENVVTHMVKPGEIYVLLCCISWVNMELNIFHLNLKIEQSNWCIHLKPQEGVSILLLLTSAYTFFTQTFNSLSSSLLEYCMYPGRMCSHIPKTNKQTNSKYLVVPSFGMIV